MNNKDLISIIKLLDDSDETIKEILKKDLTRIDDIEYRLWGLRDILSDKESLTKIDNLLYEVNYEKILSEFSRWLKNKDTDLLKPLFWIAKIYNPLLKYEEIEQQFNQKITTLEIDARRLSPPEQISAVNYIVYEKMKIKPVYDEIGYRHYFIERILNNGFSSFSVISAIYSIVANRLDVPIVVMRGVSNYIIAYVDFYMSSMRRFGPRVIFFIHPYNKGMIIKNSDLAYALRKEGLNKNDKIFDIMSEIDIIARIVAELRVFMREEKKHSFVAFYDNLYKFIISQK